MQCNHRMHMAAEETVQTCQVSAAETTLVAAAETMHVAVPETMQVAAAQMLTSRAEAEVASASRRATELEERLAAVQAERSKLRACTSRMAQVSPRLRSALPSSVFISCFYLH